MEHHVMTGITEIGRATAHRGQDAALAFDTQILLESRQVSDPADQGLGLMGVQLVTDHMPASRLGLGCHHGLQMRQEIGLGPSGATGGSQDVAGHDIAAEDEGACAVPHVLKFAPLDLGRRPAASQDACVRGPGRPSTRRYSPSLLLARLAPSSRAIWLLFLPALASKMMRPLSAICWLVRWRRTKRSTSLRSLSLKFKGSGFGPRMTGSSSFPGFRPSILQTYFGLNVLASARLPSRQYGARDRSPDGSGQSPQL